MNNSKETVTVDRSASVWRAPRIPRSSPAQGRFDFAQRRTTVRLCVSLSRERRPCLRRQAECSVHILPFYKGPVVEIVPFVTANHDTVDSGCFAVARGRAAHFRRSAAGKMLTAFLFRVSPSDPGILLTAIATILGIALVACAVPARRATRIDPARTLVAE